MKKYYLELNPNKEGYFGKCGTYDKLSKSIEFIDKLKSIRKHYFVVENYPIPK